MQRFIDLFQPDHYRLTFDINHKDQSYTGTVRITGQRPNHDSNTIKFHAVGLTINQISLDNRAADFTYDDKTLEITTNSETLEHVIEISFANSITNQMYGIYPCFYQAKDGQKKTMIATQFESHYARHAFPCIDEPAAKATFALTIIADEGKTILSNTPIAKNITKRNRQLVQFETTPKMSCYTLGFVIGDLVSKQALTKSGIQVTAYATTAHTADELNYGLQVATDALDWYENYFGVPYPLPKCDHVALPDFAAGAMENWGLVTYREAYFLVQPDTPRDDIEVIATVITHELAHMWFGNLVTMRWWDELWLNESLASILESKCLQAIRPEFNPTESFYAGSFYNALRRDALPGVQPVLTTVKHPDEISTVFDGAIVYAKGACLMNMLEQFVGEEIFQTGLQIFLEKHQLSCPSSDEFLDIFDKLTGQPITSIWQRWLEQPGFPRLQVEAHPDGFKLSQNQFGYSSPQTWPIPLQIKSDKPEIFEDSQVFNQTPTPINNQLSVYTVVDYSTDIQPEIVQQLKSATPLAQYYFLTSQILLANSNYIKWAGLVDLLPVFANSSSQLVWLALARIIGNLKNLFSASPKGLTNLRQLTAALIRSQLNKIGLNFPKDEDNNKYKLRTILIDLAVFAEDTDIINELSGHFKDELEQIEPNLRHHIIAAQAKHHYSATFLANMLETYRQTANPDLKDDIMDGVCALKDSVGQHTLLEKLLDNQTIKPQDILSWYARLLQNPSSREQAWSWLKTNFTNLIELFKSSGDYADFIRISAQLLIGQPALDDFEQFLQPYQNHPTLKREISVGSHQIATRTELAKKQANEISKQCRQALLLVKPD